MPTVEKGTDLFWITLHGWPKHVQINPPLFSVLINHLVGQSQECP